MQKGCSSFVHWWWNGYCYVRGKVIIIIRTKQNDLLCGSRIYPCSPHRRSLKILRGKGSQKPKFLRESIKANWNFQGGLNQNNFLGEGIGYFLEQCITIFKEKSLFEVVNNYKCVISDIIFNA